MLKWVLVLVIALIVLTALSPWLARFGLGRSHLMNELGKFLFVTGAVLAALGLLIWSGAGRNWLGRLPGDLTVRYKGRLYYLPLTSTVLLSLALTLITRLL